MTDYNLEYTSDIDNNNAEIPISTNSLEASTSGLNADGEFEGSRQSTKNKHHISGSKRLKIKKIIGVKSNNSSGVKSSVKSGDQVISKIFKEETECKIGDGKAPICSPKKTLVVMKKFAEKKGKRVKTAKNIVETVKDLLNCNSESCILKRKDFVEFAAKNNHDLEQILNNFFKPNGPSHSFNFLSNFNIDDVLDQFEKRFKSRKFLHIPFQMRDFEKIGSHLATVDLAKEFSNGYQTFGVVLNTDYSSGKGIHWFCIFGELYPDKIEIEYFNSSGKSPLEEVQAWMNKTMHYLEKEMNMPVNLVYTTGMQFQHDRHSCGVYCLSYIWLRLEGVPHTWFNKRNFNDDIMHQMRKKLFRHEV